MFVHYFQGICLEIISQCKTQKATRTQKKTNIKWEEKKTIKWVGKSRTGWIFRYLIINIIFLVCDRAYPGSIWCANGFWWFRKLHPFSIRCIASLFLEIIWKKSKENVIRKLIYANENPVYGVVAENWFNFASFVSDEFSKILIISCNIDDKSINKIAKPSVHFNRL